MNLTENQQKVNEQITKEFAELNNTADNNGSLINADEIKQNWIDAREEKIKVKYQNDVFIDRMEKELKLVADKLSKDLDPLGLFASYASSMDLIISSKTDCPRWNIAIQVRTLQKHIQLKNGNSICLYTGWEYSLVLECNRLTATNIEEILNHWRFKRKLQTMYNHQQAKMIY